MASYCLRCKRKTPELNRTPMRTTSGRIVLKSMCPVSKSNKSRLISRKEIEGRGLGGIITYIQIIKPLLKRFV